MYGCSFLCDGDDTQYFAPNLLKENVQYKQNFFSDVKSHSFVSHSNLSRASLPDWGKKKTKKTTLQSPRQQLHHVAGVLLKDHRVSVWFNQQRHLCCLVSSLSGSHTSARQTFQEINSIWVCLQGLYSTERERVLHFNRAGSCVPLPPFYLLIFHLHKTYDQFTWPSKPTNQALQTCWCITAFDAWTCNSNNAGFYLQYWCIFITLNGLFMKPLVQPVNNLF